MRKKKKNNSHDDILILGQTLGQLHTAPQTVTALQSGNDTLQLGTHLERLETLQIVRHDIFGSTAILEVRMFGTDRVVVETGRDGVRRDELTFL